MERTLIAWAAFEAFINAPENSERRFELIDGEIVEKMVTRKHGIIAGLIVTRFNIYLEQNPIGWAAIEVHHRPSGDEMNSRLPDVSIVLDREKPVEEEGATPYMPDVVVEIKSPNDTYRQMRAKARFYLANGTRLVWLVYPEKKIVEAYTPTEEFLLTDGDTLTGGEVLPGFALPVSAIFVV